MPNFSSIAPLLAEVVCSSLLFIFQLTCAAGRVDSLGNEIAIESTFGINGATKVDIPFFDSREGGEHKGVVVCFCGDI